MITTLILDKIAILTMSMFEELAITPIFYRVSPQSVETECYIEVYLKITD